MRKLIELKQWGGTRTDGARDDKHPHAALTRNVVNGPDGSFITMRGGSTQTGSLPTFKCDRSYDTIWAFTIAKYPGLVFVAQVAPTGAYDSGNEWDRDISGTSAIKCIGVYKPDNLDTTLITATGVDEGAGGGMIPTLRGTA